MYVSFLFSDNLRHTEVVLQFESVLFNMVFHLNPCQETRIRRNTGKRRKEQDKGVLAWQMCLLERIAIKEEADFQIARV
jgi:hypothetical protein